MNLKKIAVALGGVAMATALSLTNAAASPQKPNTENPLLMQAPANVFVVTSTADSGDNTNAAPGTLRRAILNANSSPGHDEIDFNIPGSGLKTITVVNYLPDLTDNAGVTINGNSSDDKIEINASNVNDHHGLQIVSDNNVIKGLIINGAQGGGAGIALVNGASNNVIIGNRIGTNAGGTGAKGNHSGIYIANNSNNNIIGGTNGVSPGGACTGDCNLLSGNRNHGIVIDHSSGNRIIGNFIGLNVSGNGVIPNGDDGILVGNASNNTIGGNSAAERNVISGNITINVELGASGSQNNLVQGNYIGTNSAGNAALSNPGTGVELDNSANDNVIDGNVISGHKSFGVLVFKGAVRARITNNRIGVAANSDANLGNQWQGVEVQTNGNTIANNRIAFNKQNGVHVKGGIANAVRMNSIFNNGVFGINLGTDAFTENDPGDGDTGANNLQNFPAIGYAKHDGTTLSVAGGLNSRPNTRYTLDFFYNPSCDVTYYHPVGEGSQYLGSTTTTTNGSGSGTWQISFSGVPTSGVITGTATDSNNNTSEFSYCETITLSVPLPPPPPAPQLLSPVNGESVSKNPPTLVWAASPGATYYRVIIRVGSSKGAIAYRNPHVTSTTFTPPKLSGGKTYYWRVRACNGGGCTGSVWFHTFLP